MKKAEEYKLVYIEWEDSHGVSPDWQYLSQCKPYVLVCRSAGWLIYDGKDCKVIVPHITTSEQARQQGCGDMTIPAASVLKMVELKEAGKPRKG